MKAKAYQLKALIPQLQEKFKAVLVFGTDSSGVQEIAKQIQHIVIPEAGPFSVVTLTPADLKGNPNRVLEEANTPDLMGGRRLIWLKETNSQHANIMADFVEKCQTDAFLDRKSTRLNSSHIATSRMPSSA